MNNAQLIDLTNDEMLAVDGGVDGWCVFYGGVFGVALLTGSVVGALMVGAAAYKQGCFS